MPEVENTRLSAIVEGRVQGVYFRRFVHENAVSLDLTGWVMNRYDGTVEVVAEGERKELDKLVNLIHKGPRASQVTNVKTEWLPAENEFDRFSVRLTSL